MAAAAGLLRSALGLWRGPALAGMAGRVFEAAAVAWEERRCAVTEAFFDCQLGLGCHGDAVAELRAFTAAYPLREKPAGQLMLALYRCGRAPEALTAYRQVRDLLAGELGLEPGAALRHLHQQVLAGDPVLAARPLPGGAAGATAAAGPAAVPRQLPAPPGHFAGRAAEMTALSGLLARPAGQGRVVMTVAISGMPGVGKTTLAVQFAHQLAALFLTASCQPARLRPGGTPAVPGEVIRGFLDALEVPAARIPADLDGQAALYRSLLAGRRVLVLADNARDAAQSARCCPARLAAWRW